MKIVEIIGGLRVPVYNNEDELFERIKEKGSINKSQLSEREQEIARNMVNRGVLKRVKEDNKIVYKVNELTDTWREYND